MPPAPPGASAAGVTVDGDAAKEAAAAAPPAGRPLVQAGEEQVAVDLEFLEQLEPDSMLLPLLGSRWQQSNADSCNSSAAAPKLELGEVAGVEPAAVLLLLAMPSPHRGVAPSASSRHGSARL